MTTKTIPALACALLGAALMYANTSAQIANGPEARLKARSIVLPSPPVAAGNYVDAVRVGNLLFVSGNTSREWEPKGKLGRELTSEQGYQAARYAGLVLLAKVRATLGSLDHVKRVVKVTGMVNSVEAFGDQPTVINGFSDLMVEVFGESVGMHARTAVGVASLPGNAPVEVEAILEIE